MARTAPGAAPSGVRACLAAGPVGANQAITNSNDTIAKCFKRFDSNKHTTSKIKKTHSPQQFAEPQPWAQVRPFCEQRIVNALGGCCGTTPEHIAAIRCGAPPRQTLHHDPSTAHLPDLRPRPPLPSGAEEGGAAWPLQGAAAAQRIPGGACAQACAQTCAQGGAAPAGRWLHRVGPAMGPLRA